MPVKNVPGSQAKIRGVILVGRRDFVKVRGGDEAWKQVQARLAPENLRYFSKVIRGADWYPMSLNEELDRAIFAVLGKGDPGFYREMGAFNADALLPQAYPGPVSSKNPLAVLKALSNSALRHFSPIHSEHEERGEGHYIVRFSGLVSNEPNCESNVGFFRRAVEICGGLEVTCTETDCTFKGGAADVYEVRWRPPPAGRA